MLCRPPIQRCCPGGNPGAAGRPWAPPWWLFFGEKLWPLAIQEPETKNRSVLLAKDFVAHSLPITRICASFRDQTMPCNRVRKVLALPIGNGCAIHGIATGLSFPGCKAISNFNGSVLGPPGQVRLGPTPRLQYRLDQPFGFRRLAFLPLLPQVVWPALLLHFLQQALAKLLATQTQI